MVSATTLDTSFDSSFGESAALAFITRWQGTTASELSTAQSFVADLCGLLGIERPHPTPEQNYMFERPVTFAHGDGSTSAGRIDCYRRGAFVLEAKKLKLGGHTKGFDDAMLRARAQAEGYARALPAAEGRPPFLLVVDVGNLIEVYADFSQSGATYTPFPDPRSHRIALADLAKPEFRKRLALIWTDPASLDPSRVSARVTREVAGYLATLANSLEASGHRADHVAAFLTRSLFCMFAEDVELLPKGSFLALLREYRNAPQILASMLRALWSDMDRGGFSAALRHEVLRFNGKLFKGGAADGYALLMTTAQIDQLIAAAHANWREVEPAIFGTLLERALVPTERHALGAHYTPRAYVERLVLPTVIEPLRADWADAQAAAVLLAHEAAKLTGKPAETKLKEARAEVRRFHHQLCTMRVLDPACGSGNFLYVTLEHLKRLEGEVLNQLHDFGEDQDKLGFEGETVTLQQLRGIELNERAAALAELVLWIGYLQWHIRTRGNTAVAEPVVHDYGNIECRDAVLKWDDVEPAYSEPDEAIGERHLLTRWDGYTMKLHPTTGVLVPDEAAQVPQWKYLGARKAEWPQADFIVGNPPFIGKRNLRSALGDGYVECLRNTWPEVPDSADFVMYWWHKAAHTVTSGGARRMGLITTNSLRQAFNRRVVQAALDQGLSLVYVIPDHPWVDSANGAAVRIAMSVGERAGAGTHGQLDAVTAESAGDQGEVDVVLVSSEGLIQADLSIGADLGSARPLAANLELSNVGVIPLGAGFIVSRKEADAIAATLKPGLRLRLLRSYRNGRDLIDGPRDVFAIDTFGFDESTLRLEAPAAWQWLHDRVKPERDQNPRRSRRENWWRFGEDHPRVRRAIDGLPRYLVTVLTAKHRLFQWVDRTVLPDQTLVVVGLADAFALGVLSCKLHSVWALARGATLEDRPRYNKSTCFETFPFPSDDTGLTPALRERIAALAEQIDAHRKRQQATHAGLTLTGMYNVVEALRAGRALTSQEKVIHQQGLVGVLREVHDELDAAALEAYGWNDLQGLPAAAVEPLLRERLVALNARRAAEEKTGLVRWLRPEFQNPALISAAPQLAIQGMMDLEEPSAVIPGAEARAIAWPKTLPQQVRAIAQVLAATPAPLQIIDIEASFKGKGPWKKGLPRILETLEALGRARSERYENTVRWRAAD